MMGLRQLVLTSLFHGVHCCHDHRRPARKGCRPPIAELLQIHESIPTAAIFFGILGLRGWLYNRFGPKNNRTTAHPYIGP
jgi:hypothetical protein